MPSGMNLDAPSLAMRMPDVVRSSLARAGSGANTHTKTQNSGNADAATIQVLGPVDMPASISGKWATTMLLRSPALFFDGGSSPQNIGRALTLAEVFEDILRGCQRVRVTFIQTDSSKPRRIMREGIAADWSFTVDGADDIEWAINCEWAWRGVQKQKPDLAGATAP